MGEGRGCLCKHPVACKGALRAGQRPNLRELARESNRNSPASVSRADRNTLQPCTLDTGG